MKLSVDFDLCEVNGVCVDICPSVFDINDDNELIVTESAVTEANRGGIEEAVSKCPRSAITLEG